MTAPVAVPPGLAARVVGGCCADCQHGQSFLFEVEFPNALGRRYPLVCLRAAMEDGKPADPRTMAFTMDASSYQADLMVSPDFGCVMWEAKERPADG